MRPILALILSLILTVPAFALSGATADGEDRFPYVIEIKFEQRLVCSGTVLFPRIVVTAAHCLQHKARWPGGLVYIDEYATSRGVNRGRHARRQDRDLRRRRGDNLAGLAQRGFRLQHRRRV